MEITAMDEQSIRIETRSTVASHPRGACLVAGCPCKDARIVSHRRAAFFADLARRAGETADRMIAPEPDWTLPAFAG